MDTNEFVNVGTRKEFRAKSDYEGGLGEMLHYMGESIDSYYNLPATFRKKWTRLHKLYMEVADEMSEWENDPTEPWEGDE